jgi:hypothetical protein
MEFKNTNELDSYDVIQAFKQVDDCENLAILYSRYIEINGSPIGLPLDSKPKSVILNMLAIYKRTYKRMN